MVSILGGGQYLFPNKIKLEKRLKDILEPNVDEKYYLSDKTIENFISKINLSENTCIGGMQANQSVKTDGVCTCLTSSMGTGGGYVPMVTEPIAYDEQNGYVRQDGCVGTLTTDGSSPKHNNRVIEPRVVQVGNIIETDSFGGNPQCGRVYSVDGCSPTLNTMQGGGREPKIVTYNIPQTVSVRKYEVDEQKLVTVLREHKQKSGLTNNQIAEKLYLPLTMVEHWFRQDSSFAIPNADIWQELKTLLGIKTDEFDLSITEFEEKEGVFEKANRCYGDDGLAPTLTSTAADEKIITLGNYMPSGHSASKIVDSNGITPTVMENHGTVTATVQNYRIRKLTPRECWRLMGVKDEQYDKLHDISNTQLYKMAGNSIVVDVLMGIFKNLFLNDEGTSGQLTLF